MRRRDNKSKMGRTKLKILGINLLILLLVTVGEADCGWEAWLTPGVWGICSTMAAAKWIFSGLGGFVSSTKEMILLNPDPSSVGPLTDSYIDLLQPIFVLSIVIIGFYLIFMSGSPGGRARAKSMFWKLLLTMILVSLSMEIFRILLDISEGLTAKVLAGVTDGSIDFNLLEDLTFFFVKLMILLPVFTFTMLSIGIRYVLVLITAALFPLTIFLYMFELPLIGAMSKEIGAKLWRWTIGVIFAQVIQGVMLAVTAISFGNISEVSGWGALGAVLMGMAGYVMIGLAPLMAMGVLKWIGGVLQGAGMIISPINPALGFALTAAGGLMMGQGPASAFMAAGAVGGMVYAQKMGEEAFKSGKPKTEQKTLDNFE